MKFLRLNCSDNRDNRVLNSLDYCVNKKSGSMIFDKLITKKLCLWSIYIFLSPNDSLSKLSNKQTSKATSATKNDKH